MLLTTQPDRAWRPYQFQRRVRHRPLGALQRRPQGTVYQPDPAAYPHAFRITPVWWIGNGVTPQAFPLTFNGRDPADADTTYTLDPAHTWVFAAGYDFPWPNGDLATPKGFIMRADLFAAFAQIERTEITTLTLGEGTTGVGNWITMDFPFPEPSTPSDCGIDGDTPSNWTAKVPDAYPPTRAEGYPHMSIDAADLDVTTDVTNVDPAATFDPVPLEPIHSKGGRYFCVLAQAAFNGDTQRWEIDQRHRGNIWFAPDARRTEAPWAE